MAIKDALKTNRYKNPEAFNAGKQTPLVWGTDGIILNEDMAYLADQIAGSAGDVYGPASSVDLDIALFDGTTGKLIQDSGVTLADLLNDVFSGALQVDGATTGVLAGSPTYNNGVAGVGATLTKGSNGAFPTINGVTAGVGKRYLVKNEATLANNGIYELTTLGDGSNPWVLTRTTDSDTAAAFEAQVVIVGSGGSARKIFNQTTVGVTTIGTDSIVYAQTAAVAGGTKWLFGTGVPASGTGANGNMYLDDTNAPFADVYYKSGGTWSMVFSTKTNLDQTVAQVNIANGTYIPGTTITITDVMDSLGYSIACQASFVVDGAGFISPTGSGFFQNSFMTTPVQITLDYNPTIDTAGRVSVPSNDITVTINLNPVSLALIPFDSATQFDYIMYDPNVAAMDTTATITHSVFGSNSVVSIEGTSAFTYNQVGAYANVYMAGASIFDKGIMDNNSSIGMLGTQALAQCRIGIYKSLDLTSVDSAYTMIGAIWDGNVSTFECGVAYDVDGKTKFEVSTWDGATADYSFCGIFTNIINGGAPVIINNITSTLSINSYKFYLAGAAGITPATGSNLYISTGVPAPLFNTTGDCLVFNANTIVGGWSLDTGASLAQ